MKKLRMYFPTRHSNFGDVLTPIIFEKALGYQVEPSPRIFSDTIGIGSLLQTFLKPSSSFKDNVVCTIEKAFFPPLKVMGAGFIAPSGFSGYLEQFRRNMEFISVRGEYSRKRVEALTNKSWPDLPLGDPGLLLPMLVDPEKIAKKYKYGVIAHMFDSGNPLIQKLADALPQSVVINIVGEPLEIARRIAECDIIISTAMHGLIAADSFGIPNVWITVSNKLEGGNYKFNDYYSVFGIEKAPFNLQEADLTENEIENYLNKDVISLDQVQRVQNTLLTKLKA